MYFNQLSGEIPRELGNLTNLKTLFLSGNQLSGEIPRELENLTNLERLYLSYNQLSGEIPRELGNLTNLEELELADNQLSGEIPRELENLTNLKKLYLSDNQLSGEIPPSLYADQEKWNKWAWDILEQRGTGFNTTFAPIYLKPSTITLIDGTSINTQDVFSKNKLTCVSFWRTWCGYSTHYLKELKSIHKDYSSKGFGLITLSDEGDLNSIQNYVNTNQIPGYVYQEKYGENEIPYMPTSFSPTYVIVDNTGKIVFSESIYPISGSREQATREFVEDKLGVSEPPTQYESTDYSQDGKVQTLQTATEGDGIDIVIVGDGFIDKDMGTGGKYEQRMQEAMNHFFSEEPYKTFRNRFNVYSVKAVSKHEGIGEGKTTIFESKFGEGTHIQGNDNNVFSYAKKVPRIYNTNELTVLTILNSTKYAGTCYMYYNSNASIAYCPFVDGDQEQYRQIIVHEAAGHGFAKLMDEYNYEGTIPKSEMNRFKEDIKGGWAANVDITNDPTRIQWAHFLNDSRYTDQVGIFEGALTYKFGAYRPTETSIMRHNTGGYNAPSREAIYKWIMKFSGYEYSQDEFYTYDAINRTSGANLIRKAAAAKVDKSNFIPLAPPVIIR